jgi:hypothetical protein
MILGLIHDFSQRAQANYDAAILGQMNEFALWNKPNACACEIDPAGTAHVVEIWWRVKASAGKISGVFERPARKIGSIEASACE